MSIMKRLESRLAVFVILKLPLTIIPSAAFDSIASVVTPPTIIVLLVAEAPIVNTSSRLGVGGLL